MMTSGDINRKERENSFTLVHFIESVINAAHVTVQHL